MTTRSLDDVAEELYAVEPSVFVAARTSAVRAARDAGDRGLAAAIGKLRRPTLAAWAVNLLSRDRGDGLAQLLALGEELRQAQQQLRGEALKLLSRRRHEVLAALTQQARKLAGDAGHLLGGEVIRQVEETLGAALADPDAARDVQGGRLVAPLRYTGFGPAVAQAPPSSSRPEQDRPARCAAPREDELEQPRQRERLERELAEARREMILLARDAQRAAEGLKRADDAMVDAQRKLTEATERRDVAAHRAQLADRAHRDAERRVQRFTEQLDEPR
jgi:hypothetical protein